MSRSGAELVFEDVFRRLTERTNIRSSTDLAEALGISSASVSKQKTANTFSPAWALILAKEYDLDLNYLVFGGEYARKRRGVEDLGRFLKDHLESRYDVEMNPQDSGFKILKGEVTALVERFLGHVRG